MNFKEFMKQFDEGPWYGSDEQATQEIPAGGRRKKRSYEGKTKLDNSGSGGGPKVTIKGGAAATGLPGAGAGAAPTL